MFISSVFNVFVIQKETDARCIIWALAQALFRFPQEVLGGTSKRTQDNNLPAIVWFPKGGGGLYHILLKDASKTAKLYGSHAFPKA